MDVGKEVDNKVLGRNISAHTFAGSIHISDKRIGIYNRRRPTNVIAGGNVRIGQLVKHEFTKLGVRNAGAYFEFNDAERQVYYDSETLIINGIPFDKVDFGVTVFLSINSDIPPFLWYVWRENMIATLICFFMLWLFNLLMIGY